MCLGVENLGLIFVFDALVVVGGVGGFEFCVSANLGYGFEFCVSTDLGLNSNFLGFKFCVHLL